MARIPPEAVATARTAASATKYHDGHRSASGSVAETTIDAAPNQNTLTRGAIRDLEPRTSRRPVRKIALTASGPPAISSQLSVSGIPPSDTADNDPSMTRATASLVLAITWAAAAGSAAIPKTTRMLPRAGAERLDALR